MTEHPVIPCYVSGNSLVFYCPHCRGVHSHGAAGGDGHRIEHCYTAAGKAAYPWGYILRIDPVAHEEWLRQHKPRRRVLRPASCPQLRFV